MSRAVFANSVTLTIVFGLMLLVLVIPSRAAAPDLGRTAFVPEGPQTSIPVGAGAFCARHEADCRPGGHSGPIRLDAGTYVTIEAVNTAVNRRIVPITDQRLYHVAEFWTYPATAGDCEDIALEKRRELIALGFSPSVLLMTVARDQRGEGHAILMVRTDRGDLVLDNQDPRVRLWTETPYRYLKRQSELNPGLWVRLIDNRNMLSTN
jgi:predicted transglutaminase-like cysteine proteinase